MKEKLEALRAYYQAENSSQQAAENENYYFFTWGQVCAINSALEALEETEGAAHEDNR